MTPLLLVLALLASWPFSREVPDDHVVASARGADGPISITAARLRAYAEHHRDRRPLDLVGELVEFELLAAEARHRGLTDGPEIQAAVDRAMVLRYLVETFEATWSAARIPKEYVEGAFQRNRAFYNHPALRRARHLVITDEAAKLPRDAPGEHDAKRLAEALAGSLRQDPPGSVEAFEARAKAFVPRAEAAGLLARVENLGRFPADGRYVPDFTRHVFEISTAGETTDAFRTDFGWHVVYVEEVIPEETNTVDDVEQEIRERIEPEVRAYELRKLTDRLATDLQALVNPEPLGQHEKRRGAE